MAKYNIGIDTGGTYTDAVIVDMRDRRIVASAKALTTRGDLSIGVTEALGQILSQVGGSFNRDEVSLVSLSRKHYDSDSHRDVLEIDVLHDEQSRDPLSEAQKNDIKDLVIRGLNRAERLIVVLYYYEHMTMKEIGATLDLSESRVSQMHSSILARLRAQLESRKKEFATECM